MVDFLDADGALARFRLYGSRLVADIAKAIVDVPSLSMSTTQVTQVTLNILDPDFALLKTRLLAVGSRMSFDDEQMEVAVVETGGSVTPTLTVKARSRGAQRLKEERGEKVFKNLSPTDLARQSARTHGMEFRGQSSPSRPLISRPGASTQGGEAQSQWDLLRDLAAQEGFILFDVADTLHFGKPSWFVANAPRTWRLSFPSPERAGVNHIYSLSVPRCRRSSNDKDDPVTVSISVPWEAGSHIRPGDALAVSGIPTFDATYVVDTVEVPLDGKSPVSVSGSTPVDPEPRPVAVNPREELGYTTDDGFIDPSADTTFADDRDGIAGTASLSSVGRKAFYWPVRGSITSGWGRRSGGPVVSSFHKGVDIGGNDGYAVRAALAGRVVRAGWSDSYGWVVYIDHADSDSTLTSFQTRYAHLRARPAVSADVPYRRSIAATTSFATLGQRVEAGQLLGHVGSTGRSTGPHLHFEVVLRSSGSRVNPLNYLSGRPEAAKVPGPVVPRGVS